MLTLSVAPLFLQGFWLLRWWVPRVVVRVDEGGAQGPGQPLIGLRVRDANQRPPPPGRPAMLALGADTPPKQRAGGRSCGSPGPSSSRPSRGHLPVPAVPPEEHVVVPTVPPEVSQLSQPSTSGADWRFSLPRRLGMASKSRTQASRAPAGRKPHLSSLDGSA